VTADAIASSVRARSTLPRVIVAASSGNAIEWFDFLVHFAVTIAKVFFPRLGDLEQVGRPTSSSTFPPTR
jgi:hypothetical protein